MAIPWMGINKQLEKARRVILWEEASLGRKAKGLIPVPFHGNHLGGEERSEASLPGSHHQLGPSVLKG